MVIFKIKLCLHDMDVWYERIAGGNFIFASCKRRLRKVIISFNYTHPSYILWVHTHLLVFLYAAPSSTRKRKLQQQQVKQLKNFEYDKPSMKLNPLTVVGQQKLILKYLHPLGEYQEVRHIFYSDFDESCL